MGHAKFMDAAVAEAEEGLREGGIPIGSVIVRHGEIVGRGHNQRLQKDSATLHAETAALEQCGRRPASFYKDCIIYTTLSPCAMCSGAIILYQIPHVVIGENRTFLGEEQLLQTRNVKLDVLDDERCVNLMRKFIADRPEVWNEDIGQRPPPPNEVS